MQRELTRGLQLIIQNHVLFQQALDLRATHQITLNQNLLQVTTKRIVLLLRTTGVQAVLLQEVIQLLHRRVRVEVIVLQQEVRAVTVVEVAVQEVVERRIQEVQVVQEVQVEVQEVQVLRQADVVNLPLQQIL